MAKYKVDPQDQLNQAINKAIKGVNDLTVPLKLMTREWFKGNRSQFDEGRKGPGKYKNADLSPLYKKQKKRAIGSAYPILRGFLRVSKGKYKKSGKLAASMTIPGNSGSVNKIVNKKILVLGTKVKSKKGAPYPFFLHFGTKKMPARPVVLLGVEQVATRDQNKRVQNWTQMLGDYVVQVSEGFASNGK